MFTSKCVVGLNSDDGEASLKRNATLGIKTVRIGWESNWEPDGKYPRLQAICALANKYGLGVDLEVVATRINNVRKYDDPGAVTLAQWAAKNCSLASMSFLNEGNHQPFITAPDAKGWANAMVNLKDKVAVVNPALPLATGGLSPEGGDLSCIPFWTHAIQANPRILEFDHIGLHPYETNWYPSSPNWWNPNNMLKDAHGLFLWCRQGKPVDFWLTEFGSPSMPSLYKPGAEPPQRFTEEDQAKWLADYIHAFQQTTARVARVHFFCDNDWTSPGEMAARDAHMGLFKTDGTPKPAASVYSAFAWARR